MTPWAPSQHKGMSCACWHWDARQCVLARCFYNDRITDDDEECDCCCHDRDINDDE